MPPMALKIAGFPFLLQPFFQAAREFGRPLPTIGGFQDGFDVMERHHDIDIQTDYRFDTGVHGKSSQ